jgi:hypothetical protein
MRPGSREGTVAAIDPVTRLEEAEMPRNTLRTAVAVLAASAGLGAASAPIASAATVPTPATAPAECTLPDGTYDPYCRLVTGAVQTLAGNAASTRPECILPDGTYDPYCRLVTGVSGHVLAIFAPPQTG